MEDAKTSVAKKGLPKSPAMSRATERPSRDGRLSTKGFQTPTMMLKK